MLVDFLHCHLYICINLEIINNNPIFNPHVVEEEVNKTALVRFSPIKSSFRKSSVNMCLTKNKDLDHFYVNSVMPGQTALDLKYFSAMVFSTKK